VVNAEEGWTFCQGVPNPVDDGWFAEDLARWEIAPDYDTDPENPGGGTIEVTAHDGKPFITLPDEATVSLRQAREVLRMLPEAIGVLEAYQPKPWMQDPEQLRELKLAAVLQEMRDAGDREEWIRDFERDYRSGEFNHQLAEEGQR